MALAFGAAIVHAPFQGGVEFQYVEPLAGGLEFLVVGQLASVRAYS